MTSSILEESNSLLNRIVRNGEHLMGRLENPTSPAEIRAELIDSCLEKYKTDLISISKDDCPQRNMLDNLECTIATIIVLCEFDFAKIIYTLGGILSDIQFADKRNVAHFLLLDTIAKCLDVLKSCDVYPKDLAALQKVLPHVAEMSANNEILTDIREKAGLVVCYISKYNFSCVHDFWVKTLHQVIQERPLESDQLRFIQYIQVSPMDVNSVLKCLTDSSFMKLKNSKQRIIFNSVVQPLEVILFNLIERRPTVVSEEKTEFKDSVTQLYKLIDSHTDSGKKREQYWSLQNILLLLRPSLIEKIMNKNSYPPKETKGLDSFLQHMCKYIRDTTNLKNKQMLVVKAANCWVDLCRVYAIIKGNSDSAIYLEFLEKYVPDLQELLLKNAHLFPEDTIVDFSASLYYISSEYIDFTANCLFCVSAPILQIILVKTCYKIVTDLNNKPESTLWENIGKLNSLGIILRNLFSETIRNSNIVPMNEIDLALDNYPTTSPTPNFQQNITDFFLEKTSFDLTFKLLQWLFRLCKIHPSLFLYTDSKREKIDDYREDIKLTLISIALLVDFTRYPGLSEDARDALLALHTPKLIEEWYPNDVVTFFWEIGSYIMYLICSKMCNPHNTSLLQLLNDILQCRSEFFAQHKDEMNLAYHTVILLAQKSHVILESALLSLLSNKDVDVVTQSAACFQYLCREVLSVAEEQTTTLVDLENLNIYQEFIEFAKEKHVGRLSQQKKVWKQLKRVNASPGTSHAWDQVYNRWTIVFNKICPGIIPTDFSTFPAYSSGTLPGRGRSGHSRASVGLVSLFPAPCSNSDIYIKEWHNVSGFLASLGGVKFNSKWESLSTQRVVKSESTPMLSIHDKGDMNRMRSNSFSKTSDNNHSVKSLKLVAFDDNSQEDSVDNKGESFIKALAKCTFGDKDDVSLQISQIILQLLGNELNPAFYSILSQILSTNLSNGLATDAQTGHATFYCMEGVKVSEENSKLVSATMTIIDRILETNTLSSREKLFQFKIDPIIDIYFKYSVAMPIVHQRTVTMRIQLCQVIIKMMSCKNDLYIRQESKFRNSILENLSQWITGDQSRQTQTMDINISMFKQLEEYSLKALVAVTEDLPLHVESNGCENVSENKSKLFRKYFNQLMNKLKFCDFPKKDATFDSEEQRHLSLLRSLTIKSITNLLSANVQYGLQDTIGLGYNENTLIRTSFMEVLTDLLKRRGGSFDELSDSAMNIHYDSILDLLVTPLPNGDYPIVNALLEVTPFSQLEDLANVLVVIFDAKNKLSYLFTIIFTRETEKLSIATRDTFMRSNNITTKILRTVLNMFGSQFLEDVIKPLVIEVCNPDNADLIFETVGSRGSVGDILQTSEFDQSKLLKLAKQFFDTIRNSIGSISQQIRTLCFTLYRVVSEKFPEFANISVAIALFLRFINPSIVSPQTKGLINEVFLSPNIARGLTMLSKILQNLANQQLFKHNPNHDMTFVNPFLEENFPLIIEFNSKVSMMGPDNFQHLMEITSSIKEQDKFMLHTLLWELESDISEHISHLPYFSQSRKTLDTLVTQLAHLGPPQQFKNPNAYLRPTSTIIPNEMLRNLADKIDQDFVKEMQASDVLYQSGHSKCGNMVFYLITRKIVETFYNQHRVIDHLLYIFLSLGKHCNVENWEIIVDITQTKSSMPFSADLLFQLLLRLPAQTCRNLEAIYLYNISTTFKNSTRLLPEEKINKGKQFKNWIVIDTYTKFSDYIEMNQLRIPQSTLNLTQVQKTFQNVTRTGFKLPYTIQFASTCFWVSSTEKFKLFNHVQTTLNDIYDISEIENVQQEEKNQCTIIIKSSPENIVYSFITDSKDLYKCFRDLQSRWNLQQPVYITLEQSNYCQMQPSDLPGTLLNLALLNLGSSDPSLRLAAYNLLCVLSSTFRFELGRQLNSAQGICIPENNTLFIKKISKQIAEHMPELTLEFLTEAINGFKMSDSPRKHLSLVYMAPWLENMTKYAEHQRTKVIIENLLSELTFKETDMYPMIQSKIWGRLGRLHGLIDTILDLFIRVSTTSGLDSRFTYIVSDSVVTLASANSLIVSEKIIKRVLSVLQKTCGDPSPILEHHILWSELAVITRFLLMLSFQNRLHVEKHLPELFHVITMIFCRGPSMLRASVHGLLTNCYQAMCTFKGLSDQARKILQGKLVDMSLQKFYLLFNIQSNHSCAEIAFQISGQGSWKLPDHDTTNLTSLQTIVDDLHEVMEVCTSSNPSFIWLDRWVDIVESFAFSQNPALQPRAFIVLGTIADNVGDDRLSLIMSSFMHCLQSPEENCLLMEAILVCLSKLQPKIQAESSLLKHISWFAIFVLRLGNYALYSAALVLLEANLQVLRYHDIIGDLTIIQFMRQTRNSFEFDFHNLDVNTGIFLDEHFTFALAILLMKGILFRTAELSLRVESLITTLFSLTRKSSVVSFVNSQNHFTEDDLPFLLALPRSYNELKFSFSHDDPSTFALPITSPGKFIPIGDFESGFRRSYSDVCIDSSFLTSPRKKSSATKRILPPIKFEVRNLGEKLDKFLHQTKDCIVHPDLIKDLNCQTLIMFILSLHILHNNDDIASKNIIETLAEAKRTFKSHFSDIEPLIRPKILKFLSQSHDNATQASVQSLLVSLICSSNEKQELAPKMEAIGFENALKFISPFQDKWCFDQMEQALRISNYIKSIIKQVQMHKKSWTTKKQRSETEIVSSFHGPDSPRPYISETMVYPVLPRRKSEKYHKRVNPSMY